MNKPERHLHEVSYSELKAAVEEMCKKLGIAASLEEVYDFYRAVISEYTRATDRIHSLSVGDE